VIFELPHPDKNLEGDFLIIGAGMSGSVCSYVLVQIEGNSTYANIGERESLKTDSR